MLKKTKLAALVAVVCTYQNMALAEEPSQLEEISVVEIETSDTLVNTKVDRKDIYLRQAKDVKDLFSNKLDVNVSQLQTARSGGEGVNIRGFAGEPCDHNGRWYPIAGSTRKQTFYFLRCGIRTCRLCGCE